MSPGDERWVAYTRDIEKLITNLMKPIVDIRATFDDEFCQDRWQLMEDYMTMAVISTLEGGKDAFNSGSAALVLQSCTDLYGKRVDFVHHQAQQVRAALAALAHRDSSPEPDADPDPERDAAEGGGAAAARRRARRSRGGAVDALEFVHIELYGTPERRSEEVLRPPPTLARAFAALELRALGPHAALLADYEGDPIGILEDFHCTWRLQDGYLVHTLETQGSGAAAGGAGSGAGAGGARALSLAELAAAIETATLLSPPRTPSPYAPLAASTPLAAAAPAPEPAAPESAAPEPAAPVHDSGIECSTPAAEGESLPKLERLGERRPRRSRLLRPARPVSPPELEFEGFDISPLDVGGFRGWSAEEGSSAARRAGRVLRALAAAAGAPRDDDDGYCSARSIASDEVAPCTPAPAAPAALAAPEPPPGADEAAWREAVLRRAAASEARGAPDAPRLCAAVRGALPPGQPRPFRDVVSTQPPPRRVALLLFASMLMATRGEIEIIKGDPLTVGQFSLLKRGAPE